MQSAFKNIFKRVGGSKDLTEFEHSKQVSLWKRNAWKEFLEGVSGLAGLWI